MTEDINPEVKAALEERVAWINQVTAYAIDDNWPAVQKAILELDDEHLAN